jgi:hypothetical protein
MATAAVITIAEVDRVVPAGDIGPEIVVAPGIFVDRILDLSASTQSEVASWRCMHPLRRPSSAARWTARNSRP